LADELEFQFTEGSEASYIAVITFDFAFGVERKDGTDTFFVEINELSADLVISADSLQGEAVAETAPTALQVLDGTLKLIAQVSVQFDDAIAADGRITLAELQGITPETIGDFVHLIAAGTLIAELSTEGNSGDTNQNSPAINIDIKSDNLFAGVSPDLSKKIDISTLKDSILDLLKELSAAGKKVTGFDQLNTTLPVIGSSINEMLSDNTDSSLGDFFDFYTPSFEYFNLLEVFNFDINDYLSSIGDLPGIDLPNFDITLDAHKFKLKNLIENENNLTLEPDWDLSLYLPEIWSLFNSDFQINDYLPSFQALLGLPYVPTMDQVRTDIKSYFGSFPNLKGLLDYIRTTGMKSLFNGFSSALSSEPFLISGGYFPDSNEVRFEFMSDAFREIDLAVDLESLFGDEFSELGISVDSDLTFTLTLGLKLVFSVSVSPGDASLTMRQAAVTVQVKEEIDGLGVTVEDFPDANRVSGGRFDFDARVELISHGLDPPVDGTITLSGFNTAANPDDLIDIQASGISSLDLPIVSSDQSYLNINAASDNVFDPATLQATVTAEVPKALIVSGSAVEADIENPLTAEQLSALLIAAIDLWSGLPLSADQLDRLDDISAQISDLSGGTLGETVGQSIYIDTDAAGYGWFVDTTPTDSSEFTQIDTVRLKAVAGSEADDRIDLLTVLVHEIGHVLGYDHDAQLAVMGETLSVDQRVLLNDMEGLDLNQASADPIAANIITGSSPNLTLDLTAAAENGRTITITVNSDGTVDISGSSVDDGTGIVEITSIIGNIASIITLVAPDLDNVWDLTGINAGTLTNSATAITFSDVQNLTGGSAKDTFIIDELAGVTGNIDDGTGTLDIQLFDFFYISGDFAFENKTNQSLRLVDGTPGGALLSNVDRMPSAFR